MSTATSTGSCGISFLSENLVDTANLEITTGTANAQFPLNNLLNDASAVKFRSLENDVVIVFDLQQTRTIDTVAIHGDTNGTFGITDASFKTSLTTDFTSSTATNIPVSAEHLMGYVYIEAVDHRYLELTLSGTGVYVELSNIFIGERIELLQQNLSISSFEYGQEDKSRVSENTYGQKFIDKRNKIKFLSGNIEFCIQSEQEILDDMFIRHGKSEPLWMIVDSQGTSSADGEYKLTIYGYLVRRPSWTASGGQIYNTSVRINQAG